MDQYDIFVTRELIKKEEQKMISFTSLAFIFGFLPLLLLMYRLFPPKYRNTILLLGSMVFYALGDPVWMLLLLFLTGVNAWLGKQMCKQQHGFEVRPWQRKAKTRYLIASIALDVMVLVFFKGCGLFTGQGLLPLGISFYIFKMISYQADLYRGEITECPGLRNTALYFMLFPQIAQGPIMRYEDGQFYRERSFSLEQVENGLRYFVPGLAMKVLLADRLAILWNDLQMIGYQSISTPLAWLGAAGYTLRLYFDFWGYSLMASGIMVMFGFEFVENFHHPYASKTVSEFYRRWHMTLGSWFRDYVYIPLGGSRCSKRQMVCHLAFVWILTGLWHGEGMNFLIWGMVLGLLVILEKLFYGQWLQKVPVMGRVYVLLLIPLSWVVFAVQDLQQLAIYFGRLFPFFGSGGIAVNPQDIWNYLQNYAGLLLAGVILCIPAVSEFYERHQKKMWMTVLLFGLFWLSIYLLSCSSANPFMYLNF